MKATLEIIRRLRDTNTVTVKPNHFTQFFTGRLVQAFSRPTLLDAIEHLASSLGSATQYVGGERVAAFMAEANSERAPAILHWMRTHPKVVVMLAALRDEEEFEHAVSMIEIPEVVAPAAASVVPPGPPFDVGVTVHCLEPLAHGGDEKAGNATLFRRQDVLAPDGSKLQLPVYGGNAWRGQVRDLLADHFLRALGLTPSRTEPPVQLWFFYVLYSGGIQESRDQKRRKEIADEAAAVAVDDGTLDAVKAELGKSGALRTDGHRRIREMVPPVSLLGAMVAGHPVSGRVNFGPLRPRCREWGTGERSAWDLLSWEFFTRREDYEGRGDEDKHTGMIANTEVLVQGTVLDGGVDIDSHASEIERACLARGLLLLRERGWLGAEIRRGAGRVDIAYERLPDPAPYDDYLEGRRAEILDYLQTIGALPDGRDSSDR